MTTPLEDALDWGTAVDTTPDNIIHYYFYGSGEATPVGISAGWTNYEKGQVRAAFDTYEAFLDITYLEVEDVGDADFMLATYVSGSSVLGSMAPPGYPNEGLGKFNTNGTGWGNGLEQGGFGFVTIIHELGHGHGLAHPHDTGGTSTSFPGVSSAFNDYGQHDLNQGVFTTMTYNDGWQTNPDGESPSNEYGYQGTPMAIDIAVLQAKYGANMDYKTGDNTYKLPKSNGPGTFYSAIWDAGGEDTISHSGGRAAVIDLRAATLEVEPGGGGFISYADGVFGGFTIANGVIIENAIGGDKSDFLSGNSVDNTLNGGRGKDELKGRNGNDTLKGGKGKDELKGGAKSDWLNGGKGDDVLNGGGGADHYAFLNSPGKGVDTIKTFETDEQILLDASAFGLPDDGVPLDGSLFRKGANAKTADHRIIHNSDNGKLFYDSDGSGGGGKILFAKLDPGILLSSDDFFVV
ncbi:M10 family metallopeptidase C-terminal domain-containing protein [Bauldia sp.]|uniref:M10 family metallopeptidase C-terminal domain-containing protein n=1 Tax=Bauldia sp. TaxID=2575872 RepID=UPI003BA88E05